MSTWLRLILITMTVGGGFAGFCVGVQTFFRSSNHSAYVIALFGVMMAFQLFVTVSGLIFVQHPRETRPLFAALLIQVPWFSCSWFLYKFTSGFDLLVGIIYPKGAEALTLRWNGLNIGGESQFSLGHNDPLILGLNLWAILMLVLLHRSKQLHSPGDSSAEEPTAPSAIDTPPPVPPSPITP